MRYMHRIKLWTQDACFTEGIKTRRIGRQAGGSGPNSRHRDAHAALGVPRVAAKTVDVMEDECSSGFVVLSSGGRSQSV